MADNTTVADIATLKNEIIHLRKELSEAEEKCRAEFSAIIERVKPLEDYRDKADKYSWMAIGAVAAGVAVVSLVTGAREKISKFLVWALS